MEVRGHQITTNADLAGADLTDTDLRTVDLTGAWLGGAVLSGSDLSDARLVGADLRHAICRRTVFADADLHHANLWSADLTDARLGGAVLSRCWLGSARLTGTDLRSADLGGAWMTATDLTGAALGAATLAGTSMTRTCMREADLTGVFAGELFAEHALACERAKACAMQAVDAPFEVVVTTNSGYPLDQNLYQSVKGIRAAHRVVAEGGSNRGGSNGGGCHVALSADAVKRMSDAEHWVAPSKIVVGTGRPKSGTTMTLARLAQALEESNEAAFKNHQGAFVRKSPKTIATAQLVQVGKGKEESILLVDVDSIGTRPERSECITKALTILSIVPGGALLLSDFEQVTTGTLEMAEALARRAEIFQLSVDDPDASALIAALVAPSSTETSHTSWGVHDQ